MSWEKKQKSFELLKHTPTADQELIHRSEARIRLVTGGERGGKSLVGAMDCVGLIKPGNLIWLVGPTYEDCVPEWNYILDAASKLRIILKYSRNKTGSRWISIGGRSWDDDVMVVTKSADDPEKLAREAPHGVIGCEAGRLTYEAFLRLRGRVAEMRGWILLTGTLEQSVGWYPEYWKRWQSPNEDEAKSFSLPSWSNVVIYPKGEEDSEILRLKSQMSESRFLERHGGVPCPPSGLVFGEFTNKYHVGNFSFNPDLPVYLWIDPGYAGAYAVEVAQIVGDSVYIVDEVYEQGLVTEQIITICEQKPWWGSRGGGAVDIAATQHHGMPAVYEAWLSQAKMRLSARKVEINEGVERLKTFLKINPITGKPLFFVDSKCRGLLCEFGAGPPPIEGMGQYKWQQSKDGVVVGKVPRDRDNHAIKACIYGLVSQFGIASRPRFTVKSIPYKGSSFG